MRFGRGLCRFGGSYVGSWCMAVKKLARGAISARRFERQKRVLGPFFKNFAYDAGSV